MSEKKKKDIFFYQKNASGHSVMMCVIGCYLCYLGGEIGWGAFHGDESMPTWLSVIFAIVFVALGVGVVFYGYKIWQNGQKAKKESEQEKLEAGEK